jgi:hypothetical protein
MLFTMDGCMCVDENVCTIGYDWQKPMQNEYVRGSCSEGRF